MNPESTASKPSKDAPRLDLSALLPEAAVDLLLEYSANAEVSDLFFCTNADEVLVLVRYLGLMRPISSLSLDQGRRCLTHIKALAGMDITEKTPAAGWPVDSSTRQRQDTRSAA